MATFKIAFDKTSVFEGGYSFNPNDKGGETFRGIARNMFPSWDGWTTIDSIKKSNPTDFNKFLMNDVTLTNNVMNFYKKNFWDIIIGDLITDQNVANNIYDFAVNSGISRAVKYAQTIVKTTVDGQMGPHTIGLINTFGAESFVREYKKSRMDFLNKIVQNNPSQKTFLAGWTSRTQNA
jgi:lysozyme family protein